MNYADAIGFLYGLEHGSVKLGLERIEAAVDRLGHPERRYVTVHVAGTNGKGSTAAFLASILEAAGYRTGLLTSPHLLEYGERMRIAGRMLPKRRVAALTTRLRPLILETRLSYFEATTALAFEAFAREGVEAAVIEVGMGGRLDATNVISPALTVVTGIELDHTKSLGRTRSRIAAEKAGIMKPKAPMLIAPCTAAVREVFQRRGQALGAPVHVLEDRASVEMVEPHLDGTRFRFKRPGSGEQCERSIGLRGEHQARNALLAEEASRLLSERGLRIPEDARARGLATARWPGRFQVAPAGNGRGAVILDVAHNPSGCATVVDTYRRWMSGWGQPVLLVGMLGDKDHAAFFRRLRRISDRLYLIPLESSRACPVAELADQARVSEFEPRVFSDVSEAWDQALAGGRPVLVTGSFHTVEAVMKRLGMRPEADLFVPDRTATRCG